MPPYQLPQLTDQLHLFQASAGHPGGGILLDPELSPGEPPWRWLQPSFYGNAAHPITGLGGRGAAWFVLLPNGGTPAALRHYRRGGLPARVGLHEKYLWRGIDKTRCLTEFRLLTFLRGHGLAVPRPLAAGWWKHGPFYRQALLTEQIVNVRSLASMLQARAFDEIPWERIGEAIGLLHRTFVIHPDLNAHNILIADDDTPWLIDFDRGRIVDLTPTLLSGNLHRLARSVRKILDGPTPPQWNTMYQRWRDVFDGKIRPPRPLHPDAPPRRP